MRDLIGVFFSAIFLVLGAAIVFDAVNTSDPGQSARVIAGAAILALGITTSRFVLMSWWKERKLILESREVSRQAQTPLGLPNEK
jgi:cytochrome c biogenesis protein CcdA